MSGSAPLGSPQPNILAPAIRSGLSWRFWAMIPLAGVCTGFAGGLLMRLLRAAQHLAWSYHSGVFLTAVEHASFVRRVVVLVSAGVLAGAVRWLLQQRRPGGHSAELAAAIWFRSGRVPAIATTVRAALSIVLVGMGASLGREAAPKQAGAVIANALSDRVGLSSVERRLLVACAAGAGMAAVYNVPFGGALFALEVLLGSLALPLIAPALATALTATAISWLLLPDAPTYSIPHYTASPALIGWAVLIGPLAGLGSVLYVRAIAWSDALKPKGWRLLVTPVVVFALLGATAMAYPQLLGNGKDIVQITFLGPLALSVAVPLLVLKVIATSACLGSGAPGGLFTPTMTCGALLGAVLGSLWGLLGGSAVAGSCAIVGSAAVLAAATEGPVCAVVLVLELTHASESLMVPMLLAVAGAIWVSRHLEPRSIYSGRIHAARSAAQSRPLAADVAGSHLISSDYASISAAARYPEVLESLLGCNGRPVYVLAEDGELVGTIERGLADAAALTPIQRAIATAADLARPTVALHSFFSAGDLIRGLETAAKSELPVLEEGSARMIGVVRR